MALWDGCCGIARYHQLNVSCVTNFSQSMRAILITHSNGGIRPMHAFRLPHQTHCSYPGHARSADIRHTLNVGVPMHLVTELQSSSPRAYASSLPDLMISATVTHIHQQQPQCTYRV